MSPLTKAQSNGSQVAHAGFVLEHLPDPLQVVRNMADAVRPGGRVILSDDDYKSLRLWPEPPGFAQLWTAYQRTYDRHGNAPVVGRQQIAKRQRARFTRAQKVKL
jgi:SAM-dependent methyltransferase